MKQFQTLSPLFAAVSLAGLYGCSNAVAQGAGGKAAREIELTVYKDDFGMVRESRALDLSAGRNVVRLGDVSRELDPKSVIFDWGGKAGAPEMVANTYDLGVGSGEGLLKRFEGKKVDMLWNSAEGKPGDRISGTLEAVGSSGNFVLRSDGKYYVNPRGTIIAPDGGDVVTMPQLSAEVDSPSKQSSSLSVGYLTRGLSWSADYTATLSSSDDTLKLECWATVTNRTGVDFPLASLTLMAGSPNRATVSAPASLAEGSNYRMVRGGGGEEADMYGRDKKYKGEMQPQAMGELQAYKVPKVASIGQDQMNRVVMLSGAAVPVKKDYSMRLPGLNGYEWYGDYSGRSTPRRLSCQLAINFFNTAKSTLGVALPGGAVRVYTPDASGHPAFIGAAAIRDTPNEARVDLTLSNVFDVYGETRTLKSQRIDKRTVRKTMEMVLHNEKSKPVDVRMVQSLYGKWKIVRESHKSSKLDAYTMQRIVTVPAGEKVTVTAVLDMAG